MRSLIAIVLLAVLEGCAAPVPWVNNKVPVSQWSHDWSECKSRAEYQVFGARDLDEPTNNPLESYDRIQGKESVDDLVGSCMIRRGYVPAAKKS